MTYIEDHIVGIPYIVVRGPQPAEMAETVARNLPLWSYEQALELLRNATTRDDKVAGTYLTALSAPPEESTAVVEEFRALAHDDEPDVRHALLVGIGYLPRWPALRELATEIQTNDPSPEVRRDAGYLIEGLDLPEVY